MHEIVLKGCAYLGGCNYPIAVGDSAILCFGLDEVSIRFADGASFSVPYFELALMEISGPGTLTSGGGFAGGGFGVSGALEGIAIASVLNALTTKSKIHTFVSFTTNIGELHFHYGEMEPAALRIALSQIRTTLRRLSPHWRQERLAGLQFAHTHAALSESELARMTCRLSALTVEAGVPPPAKPLKSSASAATTTAKASIPPPAKPKDVPPPPIVGPRGRCPNCGITVPLHVDECMSCKALFGPESAWKVLPLQ